MQLLPKTESLCKPRTTGLCWCGLQKASRSPKNAGLPSPANGKNEKQTSEITANPGLVEKLPHPPAHRCNFCNSMETGRAAKCSRRFDDFPDFYANRRFNLMTQGVELMSPESTTANPVAGSCRS